MTLRRVCGLALSAFCLPAMAFAAPKLDPLFGDHAVIQRNQPVTITGVAEPGEAVTVTLGTAQVKIQADGSGQFAARFAPQTVPGAIALSADTASGKAVADDVQIGDVYLCSGQSNMEMPVRGAQDAFGQSFSSNDPLLRLLTVEKAIAFTPQTTFAKPVSWNAAKPQTVLDFSAVCYYMAKELRKSAAVPIGAIASSWGGTQISPWMGENALKAAGLGDRAALLKLYAKDRLAGERAAIGIWEEWWRKNTGDRIGYEPWQPSAEMKWVPVPSIDVWSRWGVPALSDYIGMVWFRREVTLTKAQAQQAAELGMGGLDDIGLAWVNGQGVGAVNTTGQSRTFVLPKGVLKAGKNVIVVNIHNTYADGGLRGPADALKLEFADHSALPLKDGWLYEIAALTPRNPPRKPWEDLAGASTVYNAMIAPLGEYGLKGVVWYQGESDTDFPGYEGRLKAMAADWRKQFNEPDLAFVIIQLTGYGQPATGPGESGWASVRDAKRRMAQNDPHAAIVATIDLGDPFDIHPGEKHEVGRRAARAMRAKAYGDVISPSGPEVAAASLTKDGTVVIRFKGVTGGLHTRSSSEAIGFELCGAEPGTCRYVSGHAAGDQVFLKSDGQPVSRVRYAWADYPVVNLFDEARLPVSTFEMTVDKQAD